jgi:uncharacterized protein YdaU (DUF1376 family)
MFVNLLSGKTVDASDIFHHGIYCLCLVANYSADQAILQHKSGANLRF